jgi:hypothetical protein
MEDRIARIADVLHQAAETHHTVYRITNGADDDWASWYASWLIELSDLPALLGVTPVRSELVYLLVRLGKEYAAGTSDERWEDHYARALAQHFAGT